MGGTNPMAAYTLLDNTSQTATAYKAGIDANSVVASRIVQRFAPHAQSTPNMTARLDAGSLFDGVTLTEVAGQNTGTITAPVAHPRIDRVVIDNATGTLSVVTGTEAVSPAPPAIPAGKSPVAQIALQTSTTAITNAMITDERNFSALNTIAFGTQTALSSAATCDLGTVLSHNVKITGTTTISSFGSSAGTQSPIYFIEFASALTLTYSSALLLPGGTNITTAPGDWAIGEYLAPGNWQVIAYFPATGVAAPAQASDQVAGTASNLFTSPATQQAHLSAAKAWVLFGSTGAIADSYNVSSVTITASGNYSTNFATPFSNNNYVPSGITQPTSGIGSLNISSLATCTTSSAKLTTVNNVTYTSQPTAVAFYGRQ